MGVWGERPVAVEWSGWRERCIEGGPKASVKHKRGVEVEGDAVAFARGQLGFEPDAAQAELLRSRSKRVVLNCSRQWGKSTVAAVKALHRAWTVPGSLVVVGSPSERQSAELLRKARALARGLVGSGRLRGDGTNRTSLALPNGSRIVGLPDQPATVRGFSGVSLLLLDEASRVPDETYVTLRPMLAVSGGDLWLLSTPGGKSGFFWEAWELGGEEWARFRGPATECKRISAEWLESERRALGDRWFRQEYLCEFVADGSALFDREAILEAVVESEVW